MVSRIVTTIAIIMTTILMATTTVFAEDKKPDPGTPAIACTSTAKITILDTTIIAWHDSRVDLSSKQGKQQSEHLRQLRTRATTLDLTLQEWDIAPEHKGKDGKIIPCYRVQLNDLMEEEAESVAGSLSKGKVAMQRLRKIRLANGAEDYTHSPHQIMTAAVGWQQVDLFAACTTYAEGEVDLTTTAQIVLPVPIPAPATVATTPAPSPTAETVASAPKQQLTATGPQK